MRLEADKKKLKFIAVRTYGFEQALDHRLRTH
jgi:hypothetical protein